MDLPEPLPDAMIPPMILLPLVENAVKHGPAAGHAGPMGLSIVVAAGMLRIRVRNPGPFNGPRVGGEGLAMVERRLALMDSEARFVIFEQEGHTIAEVILPAVRG